MNFGTEETEEEADSTSIKGLKASGSLLIEGGSFVIDSADDAIHSNMSVTIEGGSFEIASGDDGVHADEKLTINACTMKISESYEGLEAQDVVINGGDISLVASDDGLNAAGGTDSSGTGGRGGDVFGPGMMGGMSVGNGSITISGGNLYMEASGDGIDANGHIEMTGGYVVVCGPNKGDTATLDYDTTATISGGTFIGSGASGMAQTFSDSSQGVIACSIGNQSAGSTITLNDAGGNVIVEYEPPLDYAVFIYSSEEIVKGETYTLTVGSLNGDVDAY
ncbi:MAG: carbohydrate-binding domain-containing protein [Firmicutes bacterium]|nr:carbohydrate-binding domain-containing protein [Bacillota bacterium]